MTLKENDLSRTVAFATKLERRLGTLEAIETGDQLSILKPMLRASVLTSAAKIAGSGRGALLFALTVATIGSKRSESFDHMIEILTQALRPLFPKANLGQRRLLPLLLTGLLISVGTLTQLMIREGTPPQTVNLLLQFVYQTKVLQQLAEGVAKASGGEGKTFGLASHLLTGMMLLLIVQTAARKNLKVMTMLIENVKEDLVKLLEGPSSYLAESVSSESAEASKGIVQLQTFVEALRQGDLEGALAIANTFQEALWSDEKEHDFAKEIFVEFDEFSRIFADSSKIQGENVNKETYINFV